MAELVDLFAYLSVLLRGAVLVFQTLAVGGLAFERFVLRTRGDEGGPAAGAAASRRMVRWSAAFLAAAWLLWLGLDTAVLMSSADLAPGDILGASYFLAGALGVCSAATLAVLSSRGAAWWMLAPALGVLVASTATSHAGARLEDREVLLASTFVHHLAVAV